MKDYKELTRSWGALLIALCYKEQVTPETAFRLWDIGKCRTYGDDKLNNEIVASRKDGRSFQQIGDLFGLSRGAVFKRIEYYAPELINKEENKK